MSGEFLFQEMGKYGTLTYEVISPDNKIAMLIFLVITLLLIQRSTIIARELAIVAVYQMQNMSGGVNQNCLEAHLDNEEWRCFFAPVSTIISPAASFIFPVNMHNPVALQYSTCTTNHCSIEHGYWCMIGNG